MKFHKLPDRNFRFVFLLACVAVLAAAPTTGIAAEESSPELAKIIKGCRDALSRLGYVRYTVQGFRHGADHPMLDLKWQEEGERCRYSFIEWDDNGLEHFKSAYSFDGMESLRTFFGSGKYYQKRGIWETPPWVQNLEFITGPFKFMFFRKDVAVWRHPHIALLQTREMWEWLAKNAAVTGHEKYNGRDCIVVQVNNTFDQSHKDLNTHYVVYFDSSSLMPVAWKEFDQKGHLISELDVVAEQTVRLTKTDSYIAPRQIKISYYDITNPPGDPGDPVQFWRYDFSDISTDPATGEGFSLDLTGAKYMYDDDLDKFVPVPK